MHPGQCRCGATRIEASGPPLITMACHCTGCQRMTGGAYSLSSFYPADLPKAREMNELARRICFVANAVNFPVRDEPEFLVAGG